MGDYRKFITLICLFPLICWATDSDEFEDESDHNTGLVIKKEIDDYTNAISTDARNFTDLIKRNDIFMDHTLFIKEILQFRHRKLLIICPNKWGKTINLHMLKTFVEIQVDDDANEIMPKSRTTNYKLFSEGEIALEDGKKEKLLNPLLIANHQEIIDKHLGQHPVLYLRYGDVRGENYTVIEHKMRIAIARAYAEHEYLIRVFENTRNSNKSEHFVNRDNLKKFRNYLKASPVEEIEESIHFLSKVLHDSYNRSIIILIDDYDAPIQRLFQAEHRYVTNDITKTLKLMRELAVNTLKDDIKHCIYREVVTGRYALFDPWIDYKRHYVLHTQYGNNSLRDYFGFNQIDVRVLLLTYGISRQMSQHVKQWYDGYESASSKRHFYTPISLIKFLQNKQIDVYWRQSNNVGKYIQKVLRMNSSSTIRYDTLSLISKQTVLIDERMEMELHEMYHLRKLLDGTKVECGATWFFSFLFVDGYLIKVADDTKYNPHRFKRAKLPNLEVAAMMAHWMILYYKQEYNISEESLQNAASTLREFIENEFVTSIPLQESLTVLYGDSGSFMDNVQNTSKEFFNYGNEDPSHSIFNCVVLRMQGLMKFQIDVYYNRIKKADIVMVNNEKGQGFIIEVVYNDAMAKNAFNQTERYNEIFKTFANVKKIKLIGISISTKKTVHVLSREMQARVGMKPSEFLEQTHLLSLQR